jgi:hypothetical protein
MTKENSLDITIGLNFKDIRLRLFSIIPGFLSWGVLISLSLLAFVVPFWIAIFIIAYDLYALSRAVYMSVLLVYAYLRLHKMETFNWLDRCQQVSTNLDRYYEKTVHDLKNCANKNSLRYWQLNQLLKDLKRIKEEKVNIISWDKVHHIVILPTYDESLAVLKSSLIALSKTNFPQDKLHSVVGFEERAGQEAIDKANALTEQFSHKFGTFLTTFHPDGLPGEKRVKSANATWAVKKIEPLVQSKGIGEKNILVSNFDSDTVVSPSYFSHLTYAFITHPDRYHVSYQPLPIYNNNLWDAPAFSRVVATGSTFWQMIESTRPERLVTFSSHSMPLTALKDVGYWQKDIVSEDSRIFWQCLLHYDGHYKTTPLYTSVSMDAALSTNWWKTFVNQYKQKRRWGWGIENFPYLAEGMWNNKKISFRTKFTYLFRTLEGHFSWATTPIIIAGLGWLPVFFGGPEFHTTVLSYNLPYVARSIMTVAMMGLILSTAISIMLLPPRPSKYGRWRYLTIILQWILVPFIATVLSALPALDAETRLMLGRDLGFNVMQKTRKDSQR